MLDPFPPGTPDHSAAQAAFIEFDHVKRDTLIAVARGLLADVAHHDDATLARACKALITNSPSDRWRATILLAVLDVPGVCDVA